MYGKYSTKVCVERLIQHEVKPSAVFALRHPPSAVFLKHRQCFKSYIVLPGRLAQAIFSSTQTTAIFSDQDISKCLTNLFLVVE